MKRTIIIYSLTVAVGAFLLQWLEYRYAVHVFSTEIYIVLIALLFTALGVWVGRRIAARPRGSFDKNVRAIDYLGISEREYEVLELLAKGHSNREIGEQLFVSPNTVKTHLAHLYDKLEVARRTQAVDRARALGMIP
ncbi:MAG: LuxR C-terminal-related transcriptional regulator [Acidobacteria bacterium]|nr:LuxR C-terminal-related transcriptional regulator [Acidobacteriota bacterium]